jgi:acylphosphatase
MKINVHVLISGRVQGVWYRASTKQKAEQLGVFGWVRNTNEGYVEAVFEGEEDLVNKMINWCHQGPPLASVENVKVLKQSEIKNFDRFEITR